MSAMNTLKKFGLEQAFNYVYKDPDKNFIKIMDWADKFSGGGFPTQRAMIREAISNPEHPYYPFIHRLVTDIDPHVMKTLAANFFINANLAGWPRQDECRKKYGCNIYLYVMDMSIYQNFHIKVARFSRVTYIRIVMPWILRNYTDHYLYLDSDMICVGSLKQFLTTDLEGKAIGALTYHTPDRVAFLKMKQDVYFSDGLMWIDVNEWIREKITEKVFSYQGADPRRFKGQTQDLLNLVVDGNMKPIPNLFHHKNKDFSIQGILIHYSGRDKPWELVLDSDDELWRHYLDISFWESMPNPMPPKKPSYYHSFKKLAEVYGEKGETWKRIQCLFWYSVLKIRYKL